MNRTLRNIEDHFPKTGLAAGKRYLICQLPSFAPSLHFFSRDDLQYVDRSIERFWELTAAEASDESHGVAWKTRDDLDRLPYDAALLSDEKLSGRTLERIKERAHEQGWKSE